MYPQSFYCASSQLYAVYIFGRKSYNKAKKKGNAKMNDTDSNKEINALYEKVVAEFGKCEESIWNAQDAVGYSNLKQPTKTALLKNFQAIWHNINEIVNVIGKRGKLK